MDLTGQVAAWAREPGEGGRLGEEQGKKRMLSRKAGAGKELAGPGEAVSRDEASVPMLFPYSP